MKNLFLTTFFLSLLILTDLAWTKEFCNFELVKVNKQSLYVEKINSSLREMVDFNINYSPSKYFFTEAPEIVDSVDSRYTKTKTLKLKDPNNALLYALFPGIVLHGSGHFYAGKPKTGLLLLACGILGGVSSVAGEVAIGLPEGEDNTGPVVAAAGGTILFFGSWIYDIIKAPLEVKKQNQKLLQRTVGYR